MRQLHTVWLWASVCLLSLALGWVLGWVYEHHQAPSPSEWEGAYRVLDQERAAHARRIYELEQALESGAANIIRGAEEAEALMDAEAAALKGEPLFRVFEECPPDEDHVCGACPGTTDEIPPMYELSPQHRHCGACPPNCGEEGKEGGDE